MSFLTTMNRAVGRRGPLAASALLAAVLAMSVPARGALVPLSFEELVHKSKHVVTGKVVRTRSYYEEVENLGTVIFTDVTLQLSSRIVGTFARKEMTIKVHGGVVGKVGQLWAEAPRFAEGELVLVFVKEFKNHLRVTGWRQGKYRLSPSGATVHGRGDLPIGRDTPLSTVRTQVELFDATRPPVSAAPRVGSAAEDKR